VTYVERRAPGRPRLMSLEERRAKVLRAAVAAFGDHGFDGASIGSVASAAGVTKPSLYEIFASKEALYEAAVGAEVDRLAGMVARAYDQAPTRSLHDRTRERVAAVFAYASESPAGLRLLLAVEHGQKSARLHRRMEGVRAAVTDALAEVIRRDYSSAGVRAGASLDMLAAMAVEVTLTAAERCFATGDTDPDGVVEMVTSFLANAFAAMTPELLGAAEAAPARQAASASPE
jgi:AcrR family transcriptional regulator